MPKRRSVWITDQLQSVTPQVTNLLGPSKSYLYERLDTRLEHHICVKEKGAEQRLRVTGKLKHDARQQNVYIQRILHHVLQL